MKTAFSIYAGAAKDNLTRRMAKPSFSTVTAPRTLYELLNRLQQFEAEEQQQRALYPWAERFVMGYPLPEWQRPQVWAPEQSARFITSIYQEMDLGSYLVNDVFDYIEVKGKYLETRKFSDILLDGQQRLSALQGYVKNEFPVADEQGVLCYWHELGVVERRRFSNKAFNRSTVQSWDEGHLRSIYDLRSFGGTSHEEHQRASPLKPIP
jgi:hypothetical protein